jgi:hypothetical protein
MKKQTAVEWLVEQYQLTIGVSITKVMIDEIQQAKEMERQQMTDLVESLKDYTKESLNILGHDNRDSIEFVNIYYNKNFKQ